MRYHLTPVRMAKINESRNDSCRRGCGERRTLLHCWWECELVQPLWKTAGRFLKKLKIELSYDPAITLLGIYPKGISAVIWRGTCTQMFIAAISKIAKLQEETRCPSTDEWIKKMRYIHWNIMQPSKAQNPAIYDDADGTREYYVKQN